MMMVLYKETKENKYKKTQTPPTKNELLLRPAAIVFASSSITGTTRTNSTLQQKKRGNTKGGYTPLSVILF